MATDDVLANASPVRAGGMTATTEVSAIAGAGLVGGLLGWLIGAVASGGVGAIPFLSIPLALLGGAIAGGIGVYVLAATDLTQFKRALFFAAACGIAWKPVVEAGVALANRAASNQQVNSATAQIDKKLAEASKKPEATDVKALVTNTVQIAEKLPAVTSVELREDATQTAIKAINTITTNKPEEAPSALEEIGKRAIGIPSIEMATRDSLQTLAQDENMTASVRDRARAVLKFMR